VVALTGNSIAFPAINKSHPQGGLMIEVEVSRAINNIVCPNTLPLLRCHESVAGVYDAFSAGVSLGVIDSLSYCFSFSKRSLDKLNTRNNYVMGDSLSLAVFIAIVATASTKRMSTSVAVTGAIHQVQGEFISAPVAEIKQKLVLADREGFSRIYVPRKNFLEASSYAKSHLEIIPLPPELTKLIDVVMQKEGF
jgi:hypothetical protein